MCHGGCGAGGTCCWHGPLLGSRSPSDAMFRGCSVGWSHGRAATPIPCHWLSSCGRWPWFGSSWQWHMLQSTWQRKGIGLAFHLSWGGGQYRLDSCSSTSPAEKSNNKINWLEYEIYTSPNRLQCNYIQRPFLRSFTELNCYSLILQLKKAWKESWILGSWWMIIITLCRWMENISN